MRKIFVGPKDVITTLLRMGKTTHAISITDPTEAPLSETLLDMQGLGGVKICSLIFNDLTKADLELVSKPASRLKLCSLRDVEKAMIFASTVPRDELLAIHCGAGVSRSPAIAIGVILQDRKEQTGSLSKEQINEVIQEFFVRYPCASPNPLVIEYVEEFLDVPGQIKPKIETHVRNWMPSKSSLNDLSDTPGDATNNESIGDPF